MSRVLGTIGVYGIVLLGYALVINFIFPDGIPLETRGEIAGVALLWMAASAFALEIHVRRQGVRDDIIEAVSDAIEDFKWPKIKLPKWPKQKQKPKNEMFDNVTKPSTILANMLATGIMRNPEKATTSGSYAEWSRGNIKVEYNRVIHGDDTVSVRIRREVVNLDAAETAMLIKAMEFAITWHAEKREADLEADNQLKALEGIEYLMGIQNDLTSDKERVTHAK